MSDEIVIRIAPDGRTAECLYTEAIDLSRIGRVTDIKRAPDVRWSSIFLGWVIEDAAPGNRWQFMRDDAGNVAVFPTRSAAIAHEVRTLNQRLTHRSEP